VKDGDENTAYDIPLLEQMERDHRVWGVELLVETEADDAKSSEDKQNNAVG
jgi:hypothetical protein